MRNADMRKYVTACALLLGAASLFAGSGCASKTAGADSISSGQTTTAPSAQMGASAPVDASYESGASSPSSPTQSASGLVYDQPYIWAQSADSDNSSNGDSSSEQVFYKYVFHHDGTCDNYRRARKTWLGPNDNSDEGAWTLLIGNAPFQIKSSASGSSIRVDWSKCEPDTPCGKAGANTDDAFLDIQSAGYRLLDTSDQTYFILQRS